MIDRRFLQGATASLGGPTGSGGGRRAVRFAPARGAEALDWQSPARRSEPGACGRSAVLFPVPASMPTYEYRCPKGHSFDVFQRMSDEPKADCPKCGAAAERQLSAGAGLLFKGEGFYITDYRSDSYKKAAAKEKPGGGSSSEGGSGGTSDSGSGGSPPSSTDD